MDAAGFAQRGTDAGRELGKVAVDGQEFVRLTHIAARDGTVLVGDEVPERTTVAVTEGDSA